MKIAIVNPTFLRGRGIDRVILEIALRLGKWFDVDIVCAKSNYQEEYPNIKVVELPAKKIFGYEAFGMYYKLPKFLKKYNLINSHHEILNFPSILSKRNVIPTFHGFQRVYGGNPIRSIVRLLVLESHGLFYRLNKRIIAISHYLKKELVKHFRIPEEKVEVVYNGVDFKKFKCGKDKNYMLFVGRLEKYKGVHELLHIVKIVQFPLVIVGDGRERNNLENLAKALNIQDKVSFLGNVNEETLVRLYSNCSFFISASKWEGFGLIFVEAAACKKPSIAYNVTAIPEVIRHGKTGFLANNFEELLKFTKLLVEDKNLRKKLGRNSYNFVRRRFDWNLTVKEYRRIFTE
jgi:glycosyltransferase involved in cell wall biosynthesis